MQKTANGNGHDHALPVGILSGQPAPKYNLLRPSAQMLRIMRMVSIILFTCCLHVSARTSSQTVSFSGKNVPLENVFSAIEQQTGFLVFCNYDLLKNAKPVSVQARKMPLDQLLQAILNGQLLNYNINKTTITISKLADAGGMMNGPSLDIAFFFPVKGVIKNEAGQPLVGASVSLAGSSTLVVTDANGEFTINANKGQVLVVSYIGFESQERKITGEGMMNIILHAKVTSIDSFTIAVNTGFQTLSKERSTGAVTVITPAQLEQRYNPNVLDQMEGRVPGLVTYATGLNGGALSKERSVTIRGVSTIRASLKILLVVDGLPIEGSIDDLNPYDIQSMSVLKDAAATTLYGARASNGVIVITTKRAKQNRTSIEASSDITIKQKPDYSNLGYMTPVQQVDFESSYFDNYFNSGVIDDPIGTVDEYINTYNFSITPVGYIYYQAKKGMINNVQMNNLLDSLKNNDIVRQFRDHALKNEVLQQYNIALRSGGNKFQSNLVLNFRNSNKGIINARNNSLNLFYKGTYNVARWMDIDFGLNSVLNNDKSHFNTDATNPFNVPSYMALLNEDGTRAKYTLDHLSANNNFTEVTPGFYSLKFNHLDELERDFTKMQQLNSRMYLHANTQINRDLQFKAQFQYEDLRSDVNSYSEPQSYTMRLLQNAFIPQSSTGIYTPLLPSGGKLLTSNSRGRNYTVRGQLNFNHVYGNKHALNGIAGVEFRQTYLRTQKNHYLGYNDQVLTNQQLTTNFAAITNAAAAYTSSAMGFSVSMNDAYRKYFTGTSAITEDYHRFSSGYANATYTYDDRYNLLVSLRKDVADMFGADSRLKGRPFYSVGLGWNVHNETFLENNPSIGFLKLRLTYGLTGNIDYTTTKYATATASTNNVVGLPVLSIDLPANPLLTWELTKTTNIGLDYVLFNNRLRGSLDFYHKATEDLISNKFLDATEGYFSMSINNGAVLNKGVELSLDYSWIKPSAKDGLLFNTALTVAYNTNKITRVDNIYKQAQLFSGQNGGRPYLQGSPINSLYSYQYLGMNAAGQPEWMLGDKTITSDMVSAATDLIYSGSLDPKLTMGFTPEITWKGFSLSALFVYYGGHFMRADQPVDVPGYTGLYPSIAYASIPDYFNKTWTPENTNTLIPGINQYYPFSQDANYNYTGQLTHAAQFVHPADFIKMRVVTLNYVVPQVWARKISAGSVRLRLQVNNAWNVWTKNKIGIDPEANNGWRGNMYASQGRSLSAPTSFVLGASVNF